MLNGNFLLMQKVVVEGSDMDTDNGCGAHKFERGVLNGRKT